YGCAIRTYGSLNGKGAYGSGYGSANGIIVCKQAEGFDGGSSVSINHLHAAIEEIVQIILTIIGHHARSDGQIAGGHQRAHSIRIEVKNCGCVVKRVRSHHALAVVPHPVRVRMSALDIDATLNGGASGRKLNHGERAVFSVQSHVEMVSIRAGHHV